MKFTKALLFFFLLLSSFANAQSGDTMEEEKRLTKAEMTEAKKLNAKMVESKEYIRKDEIYKSIIPMLSKNTEDVRAFFYNNKDIDNITIQKWVEKNAQPEKASEVQELMVEQSVVLKKFSLDNKRLFELFRKANLDEFQEIEMSYSKN